MSSGISEEDASFLAIYGIPADDPEAADVLASVETRAASLKAALLDMGPHEFLRHLSIQLCRIQLELEQALADRAALLRFHAPKRGDIIH